MKTQLSLSRSPRACPPLLWSMQGEAALATGGMAVYSVPLVRRQCLSDLQSLHSRMKMHQFKLIEPAGLPCKAHTLPSSCQ